MPGVNLDLLRRGSFLDPSAMPMRPPNPFLPGPAVGAAQATGGVQVGNGPYPIVAPPGGGPPAPPMSPPNVPPLGGAPFNPMMAQGPQQPPVGAGGPGKPGELGTPPQAGPQPPADATGAIARPGTAGVPLPPPDPRQGPPMSARQPMQYGMGHGQNPDSQHFFTMNDAMKYGKIGPPPTGAGLFDFASSGAHDMFKNPGAVADAAASTGTNPINPEKPKRIMGGLIGQDSPAAAMGRMFGWIKD